MSASSVESRTGQASNKRVLESDLPADSVSHVDNGGASREGKRHQPALIPTEGARSASVFGQAIPDYVKDEGALHSTTAASPVMDDNKTVVLRNLADDASVTDIQFLLSPFTSEPPVVSFLCSGEAFVVLEVSRLLCLLVVCLPLDARPLQPRCIRSFAVSLYS